MSFITLSHSLWQSLLGFVFYYPLFMSYLWMMGAALFYLRYERKYRKHSNPIELTPHTKQEMRLPPVSILIPCFNEGQNAEETIGAALALNYPEFEVIAINDGSSDNTLEILTDLAEKHARLRVVNLAQNQGKAVALQAGGLLAKYEILIGIDGDALIDRNCAHWMVKHFVEDPEVAAVTGNPRIRNRSTLIGRIQVGEFSSIVGMIKRAQSSFGRLFTVSGVVTAFRKSALHSVGYWSADMLTEDIDITWKLQRKGWDVHFEPHALVWILMPETLTGLWKQRLRWAMGGLQVLFKNLDVLYRPSQNHLWSLLIEQLLSLFWSFLMLLMFLVWIIGLVIHIPEPFILQSPIIPESSSVLLITTCLLQFLVSKWLDSPYDKGLGRNYYWMIWYPIVFWLINISTTIWALPKVMFRQKARARWVSPDRGAHQIPTKTKDVIQ